MNRVFSLTGFLFLAFSAVPSLQNQISKNAGNIKANAESGYLEADGHNYFVWTDGDVTWFEAQSICLDMNMTLVSFQDKTKNDAIQSALAFSSDYKDFWLWSSGFRVMYTDRWYWGSTGEDFSHTNWGTNEPDVVNQSSSCVNFRGTYGFWQDDDCDFYVMYFMCE